MQGKMKVALTTGTRTMEIQEMDIPQIKANEVLVKIEYVGICGSDLHFYEMETTRPVYPIILGHESAGVVVEVGSEVTHLKPGDQVALEPGRTCGVCEYCRAGVYNLCVDVHFFATTKTPGVFKEYVAHEAALCFKLPPNVSTLEGALVEPLAVGFHAAFQGGATLGQSAVVSGAGCIGLVSLLALKTLGCSRIYVSDVVPKRLEKALALGAAGVVNVAEKDLAQTVMDLNMGQGVDLFIEASGVESAAASGIEVLKKNRTLVFVGNPRGGMMNLPIGRAASKELTMKGVFRYRHLYPLTIDMISEGKADVKSIVTDIFDFKDIQEAMEKSSANKAEIVKAVVKIA
ncbi:MAG: NAD(P)-dependent alcohol dehydrogenase [Treponema sp.]|nr:NAD(P)-dependent alcohol dehydrogenase [Treponema sp.]